MTDFRQKLIESGVKSLKEFGYPQVDAENILTDEIYSEFFKSLLEDAQGNDEKLDRVIDGLLQEISS